MCFWDPRLNDARSSSSAWRRLTQRSIGLGRSTLPKKIPPTTINSSLNLGCMYIFIYTGWWFGTWFFIFHNIWDVILPIDEFIFFRRVETAKTYPFTCHAAPHTYMSHFPTVESWALHSLFSGQKARGPEDVSIGGLRKESFKCLTSPRTPRLEGVVWVS